MYRPVYGQLKIRPKLQNKKISLQSANGSVLKCDSCVCVQFCIGGTKMSQDFCVIRELNRNMILGLDWLKDNNARIYMDLTWILCKNKKKLATLCLGFS